MTEDRGLVMVVLHDANLNGATLSILRCVPLLEERGWRFCFWAPQPGALADRLRDEGRDVDGLERYLRFSVVSFREPPGVVARARSVPRYLARYTSTVRRRRAALVHANTLFCLPEGLIARGLRRPVVWHVHEMLPLNYKGPAAAAVAARAGIEPVAVSQASAERMRHNGRLPHIVYECAPLPPAPAERPRDRRPLVVGSVGVVSSRKGSDLFVEAVRLVRQQAGPDEVVFELIGAADTFEADFAEQVLADARDAGIHYEPQADVEARLREWDLFVLPSRRDPFPIALLEAMGSGLPVVGTRVDGLAEQITDETGIRIKPDDPRELADAILRLLRSPAERAAMGAAGRARVEQNFTLEHQAAALHEVYVSAVARRAR